MNLAWATDVHLDFVDESIAADFCQRIENAGAEAVLLGGDTAEGDKLEPWLRFLEAHLKRPIYFVLGNHDYYGCDIESVRQRMAGLDSKWLQWLPAAGCVSLTERTALVGHGGWGDARLGDFEGSTVMLNDYFVIRDLAETTGGNVLGFFESKEKLRTKLEQLGDQSATTLRPILCDALDRFPEVVVLTHVPPFREACWHRGEISNDDWLPGFTCKAMGDMLLDVVGDHPSRTVTVLCGHTHGSGEASPLPNLRVVTGHARYGSPDWQLVEVAD